MVIVRGILLLLLIHSGTCQNNRFRQVNPWANQRSRSGIQQNFINSRQSGQFTRSNNRQDRFTQSNTIASQQRTRVSVSNQIQRPAPSQQRRVFRPGISSLPADPPRNALLSSTERRLSQTIRGGAPSTQPEINNQRSRVQANRNRQQTNSRSHLEVRRNMRTLNQDDNQQRRNSQQRSQSIRRQSQRNRITNNIATNNRRQPVQNRNINHAQTSDSSIGNNIISIRETNRIEPAIEFIQGQNNEITQRSRNSIISSRREQTVNSNIAQVHRLPTSNNQIEREQTNRLNMRTQTDRGASVGQRSSPQSQTSQVIGARSTNNAIIRETVNDNSFTSFDPEIFDRVALTRRVTRNSTNGASGFSSLEATDLLGDINVVETSNIHTNPKVHFVQSNNNNPSASLQNRGEIPISSGFEAKTALDFDESNVVQHMGPNNGFDNINFQQETEPIQVNEPAITFRVPNPILPNTLNTRTNTHSNLDNPVSSNSFELQNSIDPLPIGRISSDSQKSVVDTFTTQNRPNTRGRRIRNRISSQNRRQNQKSRSESISSARTPVVISGDTTGTRTSDTSSLDSEYNNHISYKVRALINGEDIDMTLPRQLQERIAQRELRERTAKRTPQRTEQRASSRQSVSRSQVQPLESVQPSIVRTPIQSKLPRSLSSNDRSRGSPIDNARNTRSQSISSRRTSQRRSNAELVQNSLNDISPWKDVLTDLNDGRTQTSDLTRSGLRQEKNAPNLIERTRERSLDTPSSQNIESLNTREENWWDSARVTENGGFQIDSTNNINSLRTGSDVFQDETNNLNRGSSFSDLPRSSLSANDLNSRIDSSINILEVNSFSNRQSRPSTDISDRSSSLSSQDLSRRVPISRGDTNRPIRDPQLSEFREFRPPPPPDLERRLPTADRRILESNTLTRTSERRREERGRNSRERIGRMFSDSNPSEPKSSAQSNGESSTRREGFDLDKFLQSLSSTSRGSTDSGVSESISNRRSSVESRNLNGRFSSETRSNRRSESSTRSQSNDLFSNQRDDFRGLDTRDQRGRNNVLSESPRSGAETLPDWAWNDISSPSRNSRVDVSSESRPREGMDNLLNSDSSAIPSEVFERRPERRRIDEIQSERRNRMSRFTMSGDSSARVQNDAGDFNLTAFLETLSRDADSRDRPNTFDSSPGSNNRGRSNTRDQERSPESYDPWRREESPIATGGRFFDMPSNGPRNDVRTRGRSTSRSTGRSREERRRQNDIAHFKSSNENRLSDRLGPRDDNRVRSGDRDRLGDRESRNRERSFRRSRIIERDRNMLNSVTTTEAPWFERRTTPMPRRFAPDVTTERFQFNARNERNDRRRGSNSNDNQRSDNPSFDRPLRTRSSSVNQDTDKQNQQDTSSPDNADFDLRSFLASLDSTDPPITTTITTTTTSTKRPPTRNNAMSRPAPDPSLMMNLNSLSIDNTDPFSGLLGTNGQQSQNAGSAQSTSNSQETGDSSFLADLLGLESSGSILPMGNNVINDVPKLQEGNDMGILSSIASNTQDTSRTVSSIPTASASSNSNARLTPIVDDNKSANNRNTGTVNNREIRISLDGSQVQSNGQGQNAPVIVLQIRSDGTVVNGSTAENQRPAYEVTPQVIVRTTTPLTTTKLTTSPQTTTTTTTPKPKTTTDNVAGLRAQLDRQNTLLHNILRTVGNKEAPTNDQGSQAPAQTDNQVPSLRDLKRQQTLRLAQERQQVGERPIENNRGHQHDTNIIGEQAIGRHFGDVTNLGHSREMTRLSGVQRGRNAIVDQTSASSDLTSDSQINLEPEIAALRAAFDAALFDRIAMSRSMPSEQRQSGPPVSEISNQNAYQSVNSRQDVASVDSGIQWLGSSRRDQMPLRRETIAGSVERERIRDNSVSDTNKRAGKIPSIEKKIGNFESIIRSLELPTTAPSDSKVTEDPLMASVFGVGPASDELKLAVRNLLDKVGREKTIGILKDVAASSLDTKFETNIRSESKQEKRPKPQSRVVKKKPRITKSRRKERVHKRVTRKPRKNSRKNGDDFKLLGNILQTAIRVEPVPKKQTTTEAPAMVTSRSAHLGLFGNSGSILNKLLRDGAIGQEQPMPKINREEMTLRALDIPTLQGRFMPFVPGGFSPDLARIKENSARNNPSFKPSKGSNGRQIKEASPKYKLVTTTNVPIPKTTEENKSNMNYLRQELKRLMGLFNKLGL